MQNVLAFILFFIFSALALLHFYWAVGGRWGYEAALPTTEKNEKLMAPQFLECMIVGGGLLGFGLLVLIKTNIIGFSIWTWLYEYGLWSLFLFFWQGLLVIFGMWAFLKLSKTHNLENWIVNIILLCAC